MNKVCKLLESYNFIFIFFNVQPSPNLYTVVCEFSMLEMVMQVIICQCPFVFTLFMVWKSHTELNLANKVGGPELESSYQWETVLQAEYCDLEHCLDEASKHCSSITQTSSFSIIFSAWSEPILINSLTWW